MSRLSRLARRQRLEDCIRPFRVEMGGKRYLVLPDRTVYEVGKTGLRTVNSEAIKTSVWTIAVTRLQELSQQLDERRAKLAAGQEIPAVSPERLAFAANRDKIRDTA